MPKSSRFLGILVVLLGLLAGCTVAPAPTPPAPTAMLPPSATGTPPTPTVPAGAGLSADEVATLSSLEQVDGYPLYTMYYVGAYPTDQLDVRARPGWACSLFAALGDPAHRLYGRNFDWDYSPVVLVFTDPPTGYAAVSMVDIAYLGFGAGHAQGLTDLPLEERRSLLYAPLLPFDGLNERGLAIGMAAVPPGQMTPTPGKDTAGSLGIIRKMLDEAATVDEAVAVMQRYNVDMGGGPPVHYLIADATGHAVLVEFYQGEMVIMPNDTPWHRATNFLRAAAGDTPEGLCNRYDRLGVRLTETGGRLTVAEAMTLLADVAQGITQWSVVYDMSTGGVRVAMNRQYQNAHDFRLPLP
ncbi:MAG: linear amide C-N hydrolase [Chloroflexi bacterium]|nr:linear amide C-N hydrolase [Chloroflexota bacterium]MBU1752060.1 linear amide C-N hydrolase [Chloroflexota bacterium]